MREKTKKPIVLVTEKQIVKFYPSLSSTTCDGYNPDAVYNCCTGAQKTHKGKRFRFACESEYGICSQLQWIDTNRKQIGGE